MLPRPLDHDCLAAGIDGGRPAIGRYGDRGLATQVRAGQRLGRCLDLAGRAGRGDPAPSFARARPEVDKVIGRLDDLAVMLDQDQRVTQVAKVPEGRKQAAVIARMQSDRGLIEHVQDAG